MVPCNFRAQEAEILKEELRNAKMAEKFAKDKLLEVSRDSQLYPVVSEFCTLLKLPVWLEQIVQSVTEEKIMCIFDDN